jgi:glycosyltransferase involved in cell wall biosynthesis
MTAPHESLTDNPSWAEARPILSVLIPSYRDDPAPLLALLDRETAAVDGRVEVVVLDDGGGDAALAARVAMAVQALALPARLVSLDLNQGRARGRNRLASHARARHLLFLDSDMAPDAPDFLACYLALIEQDPPVVFGGFSVKQVEAGPQYALHKALAQRGECLPASVRRQQPEKYVFTSNLLVRRDVFEAETFDESFSGWGWEDVEWGMRVARRYGVLHIDNPATHLGLDTAAALAGKYEQSAANFQRVIARHPEVVATYPSYRLAKAMKKIPAMKTWRGLLKWTAVHSPAPMTARVLALKAYRAALYAEVV